MASAAVVWRQRKVVRTYARTTLLLQRSRKGGGAMISMPCIPEIRATSGGSNEGSTGSVALVAGTAVSARSGRTRGPSWQRANASDRLATTTRACVRPLPGRSLAPRKQWMGWHLRNFDYMLVAGSTSRVQGMAQMT